MHERERHRLILEAVRKRPFVTTAELVEMTQASAATVRRDVAALHLENALRRVRGGVEALAPAQHLRLSGRSFEVNQGLNARQKRAIGRRAAAMCADGDAVIINGGTTTFQMVHFLDHLRLQVLTNSFPIAEHLLRQTVHTVMLTGGTVYREQGVILTPFDNDVSRHFNARRMFVGGQGVSRHGLLETDPLLIQAELRLFAQADELVVLVDSSKFERRSSHIMCPLERISTLITDERIGDEERAMLAEAGVDVVVVTAEAHDGMRGGDGVKTTLALTGIGKSFPGVRALHEVSFDVRAGEVHALLGENGAGKSTLIKVVSGVYRPDAGAISLDGSPVTFASPFEAQGAGIATIYQELLLVPELTVAENIFLGHAPRNRLALIDWRAMRARARELLASLDIHDLDVDAPVGALSVGNRQRVEITKALSHNARILIMDEPTAALTEHDVRLLFDIVRLLRERGVGVIYISHRLEEVFALADRVTVLRDGEHVATREVADTSRDELIEMMVGRRIEALFPKLEVAIGDVVLECEDVVRAPATNGVSLALRRGEILGIAGLVGSGRSEFAQALFGVTPSRGGVIRIDGKPVTIRSPGDAKALGIAYVPEDRAQHGLVRPMSIVENMSLAVLARVSRWSFIDYDAERALAEQGIEQFSIRASGAEQVVGKLSGGNQQKVVLGKWLATRPRILIMDEPTRGIDVGAKAEIHRLMSELARQGLAIVMISSELPEVLGMSDRIVVMRGGRIVSAFAREQATQEAIAAAMMSDESAAPLAAEA